MLRTNSTSRIKGLLLLSVTVILNNNFAFGNYSWKQKTSFSGTGRTAPAGFEINGKGYIGTGYDNSINTKDFWEYDPATEAWTQKADFGGAGRHGAGAFALNGKGYMGLGTIG